MRYFFIISILVFSLFLFSCSSDETPNANGDLNQNAANNALTQQTNADNSQPSADATVPEFTDAPTALSAGNEYFDASENKKAIDAYKQAVRLDPDLAEAYFRLGVAYDLVEKLEQEADLPDDDPAPAKNEKKRVKEKKENSEIAFENAVKTYKKIVAKNPKDDAAFYNLGRSYNKLDEDQDAGKALEKAVKLVPENGEYQTEYGAILIKLAQYDQAIRALKKAIEIDETNLRAEELLEQAQAGKKRVDFGANKIKVKITPPPE